MPDSVVKDPGRRRRMVQRQRRNRRRQLRRRTVAVLPALFTLSNLLCGFLAIFFGSRALDAKLPWGWTPLTLGAVFVFIGMFFDAIDGRIARLTNQESELGEQLDSMADMITFGAAPAFLAAQLVFRPDDGLGTTRLPFFSVVGDAYSDRATLVIAAIYVACAALRLARFNIEKSHPDTDHSLCFAGMPTPGAAGTVCSFLLLHEHVLHATDAGRLAITSARAGMVAIMLLVAAAMVSRLAYPHVANRYFRGKARFNTITKIVLVAPFLFIWPQAVLAAAFGLYAIWAPIMELRPHRRAQRQSVDG